MHNTRTILSQLKEDGLREKVLIPLFRALGCLKVESWQGNNENGVDVYFAAKDVLGESQHCVVFIKVGNITKSGKTDIRGYEGQLREAFTRKFTNPLDNSTSICAGLVYVACNGVLNKDAKDYFRETLENQFPGRIRMLDIDKICYLINVELRDREGWPRDYEFSVDTFLDVCNGFQPRQYGFLKTRKGASLL